MVASIHNESLPAIVDSDLASSLNQADSTVIVENIMCAYPSATSKHQRPIPSITLCFSSRPQRYVFDGCLTSFSPALSPMLPVLRYMLSSSFRDHHSCNNRTLLTCLSFLTPLILESQSLSNTSSKTLQHQLNSSL